jgi:hypothetical protein
MNSIPSGALTAEPVPSSIARPPSRAEYIGSTLASRFVVQAALGSGESGDLFAALDTGTARQPQRLDVVIKIARASAGDAHAREAFCDEYNQARRLSHPNIARVFDLIVDPQAVGYTLGLPPGGAWLADVLAHRVEGVVSRDYAWAVISALGVARVHAHSRDVIHGAFSPRSIWLTDDRQLRLVEFGSRPPSAAAGEPDGPLTWSECVAKYASCEVLAGQAPRVSDDVYSLSCLAYELLSGRHPWDGSSAPSARDRSQRPLRPRGLKTAAWRAIRSGLAFSREKRPASVREWLASLDLALKDDRLPVITSSAVAEKSSGSEVAIAAAVLAALGCCLWIWQSSRGVALAPAAAQVRPPALAVSRGESLPSTPAAATLPSPAAEPSPATQPSPAALARAPGDMRPTVEAKPIVGAKDTADLRVAAPAKVAPEARLVAPLALELPAVRLKNSSAGLSFSASQYKVAPHARFAEIHVMRRAPAKADGVFQWWTEAGTALEGVDFLPQAPALQAVKAGQGATLFVRLPDTKVAGRSFRVCMSREVSVGPPADSQTCAKILL